ncbi:hypothetical protein [Roseateles sp. LKC17W]|jgi:hypothetical protein
MDWLYATAALVAVALPLAVIWGLLHWQQRRRSHARIRRSARLP